MRRTVSLALVLFLCSMGLQGDLTPMVQEEEQTVFEQIIMYTEFATIFIVEVQDASIG